MVTVQAGCTISTASILIRLRAELIGCSFGDIALAVVSRRIRFDRNLEPTVVSDPPRGGPPTVRKNQYTAAEIPATSRR
jgi:hypothetical protein